MQVEQTLSSRSTHVVELFSRSRCLNCQQRNRRCHIDQSTSSCLQCEHGDVCVFTRTVSRTITTPASALTWTELTGLPSSLTLVDQRTALSPPASDQQNDRHGQPSSWVIANSIGPTNLTTARLPEWNDDRALDLALHYSSANSEPDEDSLGKRPPRKDRPASSHNHGRLSRRIGPLPESTRKNASTVRKSGSCLRCWMMKERVCTPRPAKVCQLYSDLIVFSRNTLSTVCHGAVKCSNLVDAMFARYT